MSEANLTKLLVTGGSGDLGSVLCACAVAAGYDVVATYLSRPEKVRAGLPVRLDLNDRDAINKLFSDFQPDIVIHTAMPPVTSPNLRQQIITPAYHLTKLCGHSTRLVFLSTDMVFDGTKAPYVDNAPPSPLSVYGQAKAEMEMMADTVVRTSLIYDFEPGNKQVDWLLDRIQKGEKLRLFADERRSAIWVVNLAEAILEVAAGGFKGILNIAGPESISRLELGWQLVELLGYDPEAHILPATQEGTGRPADLTLDVSKASMLLKTPLLTFEDALSTWRTMQAS